MLQLWKSSQTSWFFTKWLTIVGIRRQLRSVRLDNTCPGVATFGITLQDALHLREINTALKNATPSAEAYLSVIWANGEPDIDLLTQTRSWGEALHARMAACAGSDSDSLNQHKQLLAGLFKEGLSTFAIGTPIGNRLNRFRETITVFDETFNTLNVELCLKGKPLDEAPDHLSAVAAALTKFIQTSTRLRVINTTLTIAAPTAKACLGALWKNGEPSADALAKARSWGE